MSDCVLPIDTGCCADWATYDAVVQDRAVALASMALRALTGYRVGNCPIMLRPCGERCWNARTWQTFPVAAGGEWAGSGGFNPTVIDGAWFNVGCGCQANPCSCSRLCEIVLPWGISPPIKVWVDGAELDPSAYRVDNGNRLVRTDEFCWPVCQEMRLPYTAEGTFAVEYTPGYPLGAAGEAALGTLACEYAKACSGQDCALPYNALQVQRLGVTVDLARSSFPDGLTSIPEVDAFIKRWNPYALAAPSMVWSPDVHRARTTTWP